jgi:hypothetical protein
MTLHIQHRGTLGGPRSRRHANARTREHREDQITQELKRQEADGLKALEAERVSLARSLGIGFEELDIEPINWDRQGKQLNDQEVDQLLVAAQAQRSHYQADRLDRPGKTRWVEITEPVRHHAVPLSPWWTAALNKAAGEGIDVVPILDRLAKVTTSAWESATDFEVILQPFHPKPTLSVSGSPKTSHFQPYYAGVSVDGQLLGRRRGKGKSCKLRFAGPVLLACVRLAGIGLSPDDFGFPGASSRLQTLLKDRKKGGQECVDLLVQEALDAECAALLRENPELAKIEAICRRDYLSWKRGQIVDRINLSKENSELKAQCLRLTSENNQLKKRIESLVPLNGKLTSIIQMVSNRLKEILTTDQRDHHLIAVAGKLAPSTELSNWMDMVRVLVPPQHPLMATVLEIDSYRDAAPNPAVAKPRPEPVPSSISRAGAVSDRILPPGGP